MRQIYDLARFFDAERIRLAIGGFYPSRLKPTVTRNTLKLFAYSVTFGQVAIMMNFVRSTSDLTKISEVFLFSMTQVAFINKLVNFHFKSKKVAQLDRFVSQESFGRVNAKERAIFERSFAACQRVVNVFLVLCAGVVLLYGAFPAADNWKTGRKNYPFPGKFPFNPDDYYIVIYGLEVVAVAVSAWNNGALDCLFVKHTVIATTFFRVLRNKIESLLDNPSFDHTLTEDKIKRCIVYYDEVTKYVNMIENTFSYGILVQFLCSGIVICLTGFQMMLVISFQSAQFGLMATYFSCMMCQLTLYCWYGHILMEESNAITKACYAVKWNRMTVKEQKMLIMIMERAKRPVAITAAGIFKLNLATLMAILRSSYSYFAVLRQIYNK